IEFRHPVVVFNLGGQRVERQTQTFDKVLGNNRPVGVGDGRNVGRVGAGGAVDFAQVLLVCDTVQLTVQTVHKDREFFAQCGRGSRLAVGARQHWSLNGGVGGFCVGVNHLLSGGQPDVGERSVDTQ